MAACPPRPCNRCRQGVSHATSATDTAGCTCKWRLAGPHLDRQVKLASRCHDGPLLCVDGASGKRGPQVKAKDALDAFEMACIKAREVCRSHSCSGSWVTYCGIKIWGLYTCRAAHHHEGKGRQTSDEPAWAAGCRESLDLPVCSPCRC